MDKKNKKSPVAAVIDIGSNILQMQIAQNVNGEIHILETLKVPLSLGKDTFSTGKISFEKVSKTCDAINRFLAAAATYGITKVKAIATTAVREALNKAYVLDQIKLRTGVSVDVLDDSAEKTLIYRETIRRLREMKHYNSTSLMVYIGVGNLGVSIFDNGTLPFTQNIRIGSLRLSELLFNMEDYEEQYSIIIEDYLRSFTTTFYNTLPAGEIKHFIASGREMELIASLCGEEVSKGFVHIPKEKFVALYNNLKNLSLEQIMEKYDISQETSDLLRASASIYYMLLNATQAKTIITSFVFISDALLFDILKPKEAERFRKEFEQNSVLSAKAVARRYHFDEEHAEYVEKYTLKIFDKMKKIHGLDQRARLYLQVAAIMHDVGKYVNITSHYNHSYHIIRNSEIVGLDMHEMELVANITKYHSTIVPSFTDENYNYLSESDQLLVSKLAAILRICEALDKGHIKKFDDIDLKIKDNTLVIGISTLNNTQIEEWSFALKRGYFEEVFGMKAKIKKKKVF